VPDGPWRTTGSAASSSTALRSHSPQARACHCSTTAIGSDGTEAMRKVSQTHQAPASALGGAENLAVPYAETMTPLVLTLIGDDRAGLVSAVATAVNEHGGNWDRSQMAELAGKFAGIVLVTIPDSRVDEFADAMEPLQGLLDVTVQRAVEAPSVQAGMTRWSLELLGSDRPGIVSDISGVLADHGVSIEAFSSLTREAPMASGMLFEATAELDVPGEADIDALRAALEAIADELMVDIDLGAAD